MLITVEPLLLHFTLAQREAWRRGERDDCADPYAKKLEGTAGFGEYVTARHFETLGYRWIFHDFDVFGTNRPGKYPASEAILLDRLGGAKLAELKSIHPEARTSGLLRPETPDLLLYRLDSQELRFVECKRVDTRDRLRPSQLLGLAHLAEAGCRVDVCILAPEGSSPARPPLTLPPLGAGLT